MTTPKRESDRGKESNGDASDGGAKTDQCRFIGMSDEGNSGVLVRFRTTRTLTTLRESIRNSVLSARVSWRGAYLGQMRLDEAGM